MNKIPPEHLHLFIDEPVYVLHEVHTEQESQEATTATSEVKEDTKEPAAPVVAESPAPSEPVTTKEILIVLTEESAAVIGADDEAFLFKGLNALNIDKEMVSIHNLHQQGPVKPPFGHKKQIVFKANPDPERRYQVLDAEGIAYLECDPLPTIRNNQELKRAFWEGLKTLFK